MEDLSEVNKANLEELQKAINYHFSDENLLIKALTHRSCKDVPNNERLEFLGDAVLDLLIGEYLFRKFPRDDEGDLSKLRACIVSESGLAKFALKLNLGKYIFVSQSEEHNDGRHKHSILSNTFEAIIGAVYLESGLSVASKITYELLESCYEKIDFSLSSDYKTLLQELTQERFNAIPEYRVTNQSGPDHKKTFEVALFLDDKEYARASGGSKKKAQQKCAKIVYKKLRNEE